MISFLKGRVDSTNKEAVVIDINNIGFKVFTPRASKYSIDQDLKLYTYHVIRQDEQYLVGFDSIKERNLFLTLIKVQGVGAKTALGMLSVGNIPQLINAINKEDIKYLKSLPLVGYRTAKQIVYELKGYYASEDVENDTYNDVRTALISLGFKVNAVDTTLKKIYVEQINSDDLLKLALKDLRS